MKTVPCHDGTRHPVQMHAALPPGENIVGRDQKPSKILCVDRISFVSRADQVFRHFRGLSPSTQFNTASTFCNKIVMNTQCICMVDRNGMLQINKSHPCDAERILRPRHIDPGLSIYIGVLWVGLSGSVIHKMQPVDTEIFKFHGTDPRTSLSLHIECSLGFLSALFICGKIHQDPAAPRP